MKKYKVVASYVSYCTLEIEAENQDEAWRIANETDGGDFDPDQIGGDWKIEQVEEIDEVLP